MPLTSVYHLRYWQFFFLLNQEMKWFNNQSHSNIIDAKTKLHGKFSCKVTGLQPLIKHKTVSI